MTALLKARKFFSLALLTLPLVFLPGCNWFKGGDKSATTSTGAGISDGSDVLVSINGKPVITAKSFEADFNQLLEENPQLKQVLPFMPDAKQNFLMGLRNQEVVNMYVAEKGIDKKPEYQQELDRMHRSLVRVLNTKYFAADHPVSVTDAEVKAYYDANKDKMQELVISRGGTLAVGVPFEKEADAQAFFNKVKGKSAQFEALAKEHKVADKIRDFKHVNKQSVGIDPIVRTKITEMKSVPGVELVKVNDKSFWVVNATAKEDAKYRAFEEIKEPLRGLVEREKTNEALQQAIEALIKTMNVQINEEYLKKSLAVEQMAMADGGEEAAQAAAPAKTTQVV